MQLKLFGHHVPFGEIRKNDTLPSIASDLNSLHVWSPVRQGFAGQDHAVVCYVYSH